MANHDWTRQAIDVMTAWTDDPDNTDFVTSRVMNYSNTHEDCLALATGLLNLAGLLLFRIEEATKVEPRETLQQMALKLP